MNLRFLTKDLRISPRKLAAVTLLNSGTFAWFFLLIPNVERIFETLTLSDPLWSNVGPILFFGFAVFWAIMGSFIGRRINRRKLLVSWITLGVFSTILLSLFQGTLFAAISSLLLGMSLGLGLPSSTALIADYTVAEERARVSGIVVLGMFVLAFIATATARVLNLGLLEGVLLYAVMRSISFLALIVDKFDAQEPKVAEKHHLSITAYREFIFHIFPWVMFSIAAGIAWNLIPPELVSMGATVRFVLMAVFGLVSGIAADRFGRKKPIIFGLIMLGLGFIILSFGMNETSVLLYFALSGVAWGSLFVVFLAVPGDLSVFGSREKFYGLGYTLPLAILLSLSIVPRSIIVSFPAISQVLSTIIFLSIIPVLRVKETLRESAIQERKLKEHVEKVGKIIQESEETDQK